VNSPIRLRLAILSAYAALAVWMTYPVAATFSTDIASFTADGYIFYWILWWFKKSIVELGSFPTFTNLLFYPHGVSLANNVLTPWAGFLGIPLQHLMNLTATFNLIHLSAFTLAGYGAYRLTYYFTKDHAASFLAGLIYTFAPIHMLHSHYHLDLTNTQFIPFYALYLFRLADEPRAKNALIAGAFLALTAFSSWNYFVFALILTAIFLIYFFFREREKVAGGSFPGLFCLMGGAAFLIASPFLVPMMRDILSGAVELSFESAGSGARGYSADLAAFFLPSNLHPLWRDFPNPAGLYARLAGNTPEKTVFLGYTAMALGLIAALRAGRDGRGEPDRRSGRDGRSHVIFWLISLFSFMALALGPDLQIFGEEYLGFTRLPYNWFIQNTPFLRGIRVPARIAVMCALSVSVLAGWGLSLIAQESKPARKILIAGVAMLLVLFEFMAAPARSTVPETPPVYQKIAREPGDFALLEVPVALPQNTYMYMMYQTVHHKPITSGEAARIPASAWNFVARDPFVRLLHYPQLITPARLETPPAGLAEKKIKYILVHNDFYFYTMPDPPPDNFYHVFARVHRGEKRKELRAKIHRLLSRHLKKRADLSTPEITVYEVY
jgi:hypothetical protein